MGASSIQGETWGLSGISRGSAFVSVASRGEHWLGEPGESSRLHLMTFTGCCSPLQSIRCRPDLGTIHRCLTALPRVSASCDYASSNPWFMERPSFFAEPERPFVSVHFAWAWARAMGLSGARAIYLKHKPPDDRYRAPQKAVPGVMCGGPGLCVTSHVLLLPPMYRRGNQGSGGRVLRPRRVLGQKPNGGELATS